LDVDKVYGGSIYGDFAGGNVDIISKTTKERVLKINIGSKVNTNAITEANFLQKDLMVGQKINSK
jgi:hypothetical protein